MNRTVSKYWKTRNLYLAAYIYARGEVIVGIEADEHRVVFTFLDSANLQSRHHEFRLGKPLVNARIYSCAISTLKNKAIDSLLECHGR